MAKINFHMPRKLSGASLKKGNVNVNRNFQAESSAFNSLPSNYEQLGRNGRVNSYQNAQNRHNPTVRTRGTVQEEQLAKNSAFNQLPSDYEVAKNPRTQYKRTQKSQDAYEEFHNTRQQTADEAREKYFDRLDEKKQKKKDRRQENRQQRKEQKRIDAANAEAERLKPINQVQRYKDQINASRMETHIRGGGARSGAGMSEEKQLGMMKEDIGTRFKGNGGWGGVGRGAVQGAAIGGLAGGTVESMQGGDFWDGAKSGAMMGATGMAGLRAAKQATGAKTMFRGENNIMNTYNRQTEQYGVGVKALMMNNRMANKAKDVMNWKKDR